jgi:hypothetical protein
LPTATGSRNLLDGAGRGGLSPAGAQPMSTRRQRRSRLIAELRLAIDRLPVQTRVAMLEGVRSNEIIVGAYVDRRGGVCPMLAAHRCGGRTDFLGFARSWDRFTGARGRARRATERELGILVAHLEASLLADSSADLEAAIAAHHALVAGRRAVERRVAAAAARRAEPRARPGDPFREHELRRRPGNAWLRVFRQLDDYEHALARVQAERDELLARRAQAAGRDLTLV